MAVKKQKWELTFESYKNKDLKREWNKLENQNRKELQEIESKKQEISVKGAGKDKQKWTKLNEEIKELEGKIEKRKKEIKKLQQVEKNMPRIEKLKGLLDKQFETLEHLLEQKEAYKETQKYKDELNKIKEEIDNLDAKIAECDAIISKEDSSEEQKQEALAKKDNLIVEKGRKQNEFEFGETRKKLNGAIAKARYEVSDKRIEFTKEMIRKLNFQCRLLVNGKTMDEVQVSLGEWNKEFKKGKETAVTAPEVTISEVTAPEVTAPEVTVPEATAPEVKAPEVTAPEVTVPDVTAQEGTLPVPVSEFEQKHPRLAAIGKFFKNIFGKTSKESVLETAAPETIVSEELTTDEPTPEPETPIKSFKTSLKVTEDMLQKQSKEAMQARKEAMYKRMAETGSTMKTKSELDERAKINAKQKQRILEATKSTTETSTEER